MNLSNKLISMLICLITISCESKPIESHELIGKWDIIKRWGKGPMKGSIIFKIDGTCETINLPWGAITGEEADLAKLKSVKGTWEFDIMNEKKVINISFSKPEYAGFDASISPELRSEKWTFRQYIGDPDIMDIIEFQKMPTGNR